MSRPSWRRWITAPRATTRTRRWTWGPPPPPSPQTPAKFRGCCQTPRTIATLGNLSLSLAANDCLKQTNIYLFIYLSVYLFFFFFFSSSFNSKNIEGNNTHIFHFILTVDVSLSRRLDLHCKSDCFTFT